MSNLGSPNPTVTIEFPATLDPSVCAELLKVLPPAKSVPKITADMADVEEEFLTDVDPVASFKIAQVLFFLIKSHVNRFGRI